MRTDRKPRTLTPHLGIILAGLVATGCLIGAALFFMRSVIPACGSETALQTLNGIIVEAFENGSSHKGFVTIVAPSPNADLPTPIFNVVITQMREQREQPAPRDIAPRLSVQYDKAWYEKALTSSTKLTQDEQSKFAFFAVSFGINVSGVSKSFDYTIQRTDDGDTYVEVQ